MDRNSEARYGAVAQIEKPRSNWDRDFNYKTTFNVGDIVPFYFDMDIIPGTTIKNTTSMVIRMNTPLTPIMDNLYVDTYWFKCSKFWYWDHFRAMMGENSSGAWAQTIDYEEPYITTNGNESAGDLACYLGVRQKTAGQKWSKMAVNCYIDIYNQWFRDQNLIAPIQYDTTDTNLSADGTINTGFGLLKAAKFHDYMTSLLPQPQKGGAVQSPIGTSAPVFSGSAMDPQTITNMSNQTIRFLSPTGTFTGGTKYKLYVNGSGPNGVNTNQIALQGTTETITNSGTPTNLYPANLYADLSQAVAATINAQRLAFATQRILERDSMNGTRYAELLGAHYGSYPDDESLLRPEYLGGRREPINITQIVQNSSTDNTSPLGYTGAMSLTAIQNEDFTKSFTKDDILVGLMVVRYTHSYQQGLPRQLTRKGRLDRYWPEFAFLGNMPVYNFEIFSTGTSTDNQVFGYKEAWQEYMYKTNMITGELNSDFATSLDYWHLGDDYSSLPVLSQSWIEEDKDTVDRVLAVQSSTHHQLFADVYVQQNVTAPIPLHRVPGLIDHF